MKLQGYYFTSLPVFPSGDFSQAEKNIKINFLFFSGIVCAIFQIRINFAWNFSINFILQDEEAHNVQINGNHPGKSGSN
jgi:hypothetical protein